MALVGYSDSEESDVEAPVAAPKPTHAAKSTLFQKTEARKIRVDLPSVKPETSQHDDDGDQQPPAKRARTAGTFGGFNSMLPAPKRPAAQQTGLKKGVSLKTSSEAAFSRMPPPATHAGEAGGDDDYDEFGNRRQQAQASQTAPSADGGSQEVKIVGKATKFRPLSVANNKKKKVAKKPVAAHVDGLGEQSMPKAETPMSAPEPVPRVPAPKAKKSLFSVQAEDDVPVDATTEDDGFDVGANDEGLNDIAPPATQQYETHTGSAIDPNALESMAADLNLTPAQRRQLFGRNTKGMPANIAHFNMDAEYAANEQIRQSGETVEHRAVKTVAPGKHSLQQLVNNARTNQDSIEDKWAEGRRIRGEGGSKYGWSK